YPISGKVPRQGPRWRFGEPTLWSDRPPAYVLCDHEQVAVRVLHENFSLSALTISGPAPHLTWPEIDWPVAHSEGGQYPLDARKVDLEHGSLAKGKVQRSRLETTMPLAQHDLVAFRMLQIGEPLFRPLEGGLKAEDVPPERQARPQIVHMELDNHARPTAPRWRAQCLGRFAFFCHPFLELLLTATVAARLYWR